MAFCEFCYLIDYPFTVSGSFSLMDDHFYGTFVIITLCMWSLPFTNITLFFLITFCIPLQARKNAKENAAKAKSEAAKALPLSQETGNKPIEGRNYAVSEEAVERAREALAKAKKLYAEDPDKVFHLLCIPLYNN